MVAEMKQHAVRPFGTLVLMGCSFGSVAGLWAPSEECNLCTTKKNWVFSLKRDPRS